MVKEQVAPADTDALGAPPRWYDSQWREKIEIARQERAAAQKASDKAREARREKKPVPHRAVVGRRG